MSRPVFETVVAALLPLFFLAGCGAGSDDHRPTATLSGVVTLDGNPLPAGSIQFTSTRTGETAYANLSSDGRYLIEMPAVDVGTEYDVTIGPPIEEDLDATALEENPPEKIRQLIPRKYSARTTSGLKVTIANAGANEFDFDLQSK